MSLGSEKHASSSPGWLARTLLRADPWTLLIVAFLCMCYWFWLYSSLTIASVGMAYYEDLCHGFFVFGSLAAARCVQLKIRSVYEQRFAISSKHYRSRRRFWPWIIVIGAGTYYMLNSQVPMRLGFRVSRPAFERLADEALADPSNVDRLAGRWAGVYLIEGVAVIGQTVVLYLDKGKRTYGFARVPGARDDHIYNIPHLRDQFEKIKNIHLDFPEQEGFNDPVGERIAGDWFVMYSGYWLVKVGCS